MLEWLKSILADSYTEEIDKQISQEIGKNFVSKADFNTKSEALKAAEKTIKERDKQLEELKASSGDAEELKAQIATLQTQNADAKKNYDAQITRIMLDSAVDKALSAAKAKNNVAVKALLAEFLSDAKLSDDGSVKGLDEEIAKLEKSENTSFLFESETSGSHQMSGMKPGDPGGKKPPAQSMTLEALRKMPSAERYKFSVENPERYKEIYNGG